MKRDSSLPRDGNRTFNPPKDREGGSVHSKRRWEGGLRSLKTDPSPLPNDEEEITEFRNEEYCLSKTPQHTDRGSLSTNGRRMVLVTVPEKIQRTKQDSVKRLEDQFLTLFLEP